MIDLSALRPYTKNARRHSRAQIKQIAKSIEAFGFTNPILVSDDLEILAGHGRAAAAQLIGLKQAPIVRLSDLSPAERKAYVLADNKLALNAAQFRAATGMRPHEYLVWRRIKRAMVLLRDHRRPLCEVTLDVGFQTQAHFATVFKRITRQTPNEWRRHVDPPAEDSVQFP
jgi:hypothetical protein